MILNKEAEKILKDTLKNVIKELEKIKKLSNLDEIDVPIELEGIKKQYLVRRVICHLKNKEYYIEVLYGYTYLESTKYLFAEKNKLNQMKPCLNKNARDILIMFLEQYPELKEKLIERIAQLKEEKQRDEIARKQDEDETLEKLKAIKKRCTSDTTIELQLPPTMNQHKLEILEENGKKTGTLTINGLTIKIIASDDIRVVNVPNEKRKIK